MKTGSQDISPPKDIEEVALPAMEPETTPTLSDQPAGAAPEETQPAGMTGAAAVPSEDTAAEPATEVSTGQQSPSMLLTHAATLQGHVQVLVHLRSVLSLSSFHLSPHLPDATLYLIVLRYNRIIDGHESVQTVGDTEAEAPQQEAVLNHPLDIGSPAALQPVLDASQEPAEEAGLDESAVVEEPDVAPEAAPDQTADGALMEAAAEEDEEDEDRCLTLSIPQADPASNGLCLVCSKYMAEVTICCSFWPTSAVPTAYEHAAAGLMLLVDG